MIARTFGDEVSKLTVLELAFSVGMIGRRAITRDLGRLRRTACSSSSGPRVGLRALSIGLGLSTNLWVFFGFMFLVGIAVPFFSTPSMTLLQERVQPERQGRVFGFVGIVMAVVDAPRHGRVRTARRRRVPSRLLLVVAGVLTFVVVAVAVLVPSGRRAMAEVTKQP